MTHAQHCSHIVDSYSPPGHTVLVYGVCWKYMTVNASLTTH